MMYRRTNPGTPSASIPCLAASVHIAIDRFVVVRSAAIVASGYALEGFAS